MLNEADHRSLGQRMDLFHLQEEAPGSVFWHPRGWALYRAIEERVRSELRRAGYLEVRSPQVLAQSIWEQSGHWQNFRADMLGVDDGERAAALKPVSCPGHIQLFKRGVVSYRDLPVRFAELGLCHRNESRGALQGLFRLRQFCQDDGHIFCSDDQVGPELERFLRSLPPFYSELGFRELEVALSGRPKVSGGDDAEWRWAEESLEAAARAAGMEPRPQPGQGAFYGPKLEIALRDRAGRSWQCGTIQLDIVLADRFDASYVDSSGARQRPRILHRAMLGSLERFIALLLEHHEGALPAWLAPEQVRIVSVGDGVEAYAREVLGSLERAGLRAGIDSSAESLGRKIIDARQLGVPFMAVVGKREAAAGRVSVRSRSGEQEELERGAAVRFLVDRCGR